MPCPTPSYHLLAASASEHSSHRSHASAVRLFTPLPLEAPTGQMPLSMSACLQARFRRYGNRQGARRKGDNRVAQQGKREANSWTSIKLRTQVLLDKTSYLWSLLRGGVGATTERGPFQGTYRTHQTFLFPCGVARSLPKKVRLLRCSLVHELSLTEVCCPYVGANRHRSSCWWS